MGAPLTLRNSVATKNTAVCRYIVSRSAAAWWQRRCAGSVSKPSRTTSNRGNGETRGHLETHPLERGGVPRLLERAVERGEELHRGEIGDFGERGAEKAFHHGVSAEPQEVQNLGVGQKAKRRHGSEFRGLLGEEVLDAIRGYGHVLQARGEHAVRLQAQRGVGGVQIAAQTVLHPAQFRGEGRFFEFHEAENRRDPLLQPRWRAFQHGTLFLMNRRNGEP